MNEPVLGKLIEDEQTRDAIHVALAPVVAGMKLYPGDGVVIVSGRAMRDEDSPIGIVDPFLDLPVQLDQKFWLMLKQNTVTSLKHHWTHPAFEDEDEVSDVSPAYAQAHGEAVTWLKQYAVDSRITYDELMEMLPQFADSAVWCGYSGDSMADSFRYLSFSEKADFYRHAKAVTGLSFASEDDTDEYIGCSC